MAEGSFAPTINVTKLREYTSAKGTVYLSGFMGSVKVAIFKKQNETGPNGEAIWELTFQQASERKTG